MRLELVLNQRNDCKQNLEHRFMQTFQQNVFKLPINDLTHATQDYFRLNSNEREKDAILHFIKDSTFNLKKKSANKNYLFHSFITTYDLFNFVIPNLTYNTLPSEDSFFNEVNTLRDYFNKTMSKKPYNMIEEDEFIATNIYYKVPSEDTD